MKLPIRFQKALPFESILGGAVSLTMATLVVKVLGFLYKIPLAHILGSEGMSYFNGAYAVYSFFFVLCSAGIPKAVSIATTAARARGDGKTERRILTLSTLLFGAFGLALSVLVACLCKPLSLLVGIEGATEALFCISPSILFVTLGGVLRGALTGRQRLVPVAMSQVIEASIKLIFGTVFAIFSQKVLLKLIEKGLTREDAYTIVQKNAHDAFNNNGDFKQNLLKDNSVNLSAEEIEECFDYNYYLKNVDKIYQRFSL